MSRGPARGPTPKVGDKIEITAGGSRGVVGIVRFFDETKFATGKWLGVELAYEGGKNDGTVQGEKYFSCPPRYGLFVKTPMVKVVPPNTPLTTAAMAAQLALQLDQEDARSGMSTFSGTTEVSDDAKAPAPSPSPPARAAPEAALSPRGDKPPAVTRAPSKTAAADPLSPRGKGPAAPGPTTRKVVSTSLAPPPKTPAKAPPAPANKTPAAPAAPKTTPAKPAGIKPPVARQPSATSVLSPRDSPASDKPDSPAPPIPSLSEKKESLADIQSKVSNVRATDDSSLLATAEKAAQSNKRAEDRAEARAAKQDARALEQTRKELEEALAENADLKTKLKNVQGTVAELKKSELKATAANSKLEEKITSLNDVIENLTLDKELAEETCEEVKGEVETLNKQIADLKIQVENAKKEALSAQDQLLKSLPNDQAEVARIVQQNSLLTDACRQLRDKAVAEQDKFNVAIEQAKRTIAKLSEDAAQLKDTKAELTKAKQEILDLREELDEQANNAEMIEELSDKNLLLGEQIDDLKQKIKELQKLLEVSEECEDNHQALEEELQAALDAKESEFNQLDKRYKLQQVKVDDLQKTIVQFRAELAAAQNYSATLEGKITTISEDREEVKNRNRDALARAMKLAARMGDLRQHIVQHGVADISVEQAQYALNYLRGYIPENMGIDETSLQLLSLIERIRSKASLVMRFMEEFYGPEVALQSGGHDKDDGLSLTAFAGQVGGLMLTLVSSVHILHRNLSSADPENYSHAAQRHKPLSQAEAILDDFLALIAKDRLNEQTPLAALQLAIDVVRKFTSTYFAPPQGTAPDPSGNPSPIDDSLPRCDNSESLFHSLQKYKLTELTIRANVRVIGDLVHQLQADINQNAEAKAAQEEAKDAEKVFTGLEELQRTTLSLVTKLVTQAELLRKPEVSIWFVNSDPLINGLKRLEPLSAAAQNALVELCRKIKIAVAGAGDVGPAAISAMIRIMNQDAADAAAGSSAAVTNLNNGFAALLPILEDRVQTAQRALGGRQDDRPSVWERHCKSIKKELMEAASMRHKLDEAHASVLAKNEELFGEQRRSRELLAKVKVLEDRLRIIEPQAGNRAELAADLSRYKREAEDIKEAFETSQRDLEAFGRENAVMKAKIKNLETELSKKSNLGGGGSDPAAETAVTGELDILRKTVRALRRQLAGVRTDALQKQMESLPALPQLKVNMMEPGHHAAADRIAREAQRERVYDEDMVAQQKRVTVLSKNVGEVTRRLRDLRSAPVVVDLSTRSAAETDSTRQFMRHQAEKKRLAADSQRLKSKLLSFLASTSHAVSQGQVADSAGALVGRVVIGPKEAARKVAVPVGRGDLARLQSLVL